MCTSDETGAGLMLCPSTFECDASVGHERQQFFFIFFFRLAGKIIKHSGLDESEMKVKARATLKKVEHSSALFTI